MMLDNNENVWTDELSDKNSGVRNFSVRTFGVCVCITGVIKTKSMKSDLFVGV